MFEKPSTGLKVSGKLQMNQGTIAPSKPVAAAWTAEVKLADFLYFTTTSDSHMHPTCDLSYADQVLGTVASGFYACCGLQLVQSICFHFCSVHKYFSTFTSVRTSIYLRSIISSFLKHVETEVLSTLIYTLMMVVCKNPRSSLSEELQTSSFDISHATFKDTFLLQNHLFSS